METCVDGMFACSPVPVRVDGAPRFTALSASERHTCGLDAAGAAYCWGYGRGGQLGDGLRANSRAPVAVAGGLKFTSLSAGAAGGATCGITIAGEAWCWGLNVFGELGNGTRTTRPRRCPSPRACDWRRSASVMRTLAPSMQPETRCAGATIGSGSSASDPRAATTVASRAALSRSRCSAGRSSRRSLRPACTRVRCAPTAPVLLGIAAADRRSDGRNGRCVRELAEAGRAHERAPGLARPRLRSDLRVGRGRRPLLLGTVHRLRRGRDRGDPGPYRERSTVHRVRRRRHARLRDRRDRFAYCWGVNPWGQVGRPPSDP